MTMRKGLTPAQQEEYKAHKRAIAAEWQRQNPERSKRRKKEWYSENREITIQRAAARKPKSLNPKKTLTPEQREAKRKHYMRGYYNANKELIVSRSTSSKRKYMKDPIFRLIVAMRTRVNSSLNAKGYTKKSRTFQIIGCTSDEFIRHIESQFVDGMSWENKHEWHIDHKVPVSIAKTEWEVLKLNHYLNLRPLWAKDNFEKNNKMLDEFVILRILLIGR